MDRVLPDASVTWCCQKLAVLRTSTQLPPFRLAWFWNNLQYIYSFVGGGGISRAAAGPSYLAHSNGNSYASRRPRWHGMNAVDATWHGLSITAEINVENNYIYRGPTDPGTNQNNMVMGPADPEPNNCNHGCDPGLYPVESYGLYPASVGTGDCPDLDRSGQRRVDTLPCAALGNN